MRPPRPISTALLVLLAACAASGDDDDDDLRVERPISDWPNVDGGSAGSASDAGPGLPTPSYDAGALPDSALVDDDEDAGAEPDVDAGCAPEDADAGVADAQVPCDAGTD